MSYCRFSEPLTHAPSIYPQVILNLNSWKDFSSTSEFLSHRQTDKGQRQSVGSSSVLEILFSRRMMAKKVQLGYVFISHPDSISLLNTVKLHFQETYNIRIRYPDIIGVNISGKKNPHPSVIPAELCQVIPGQLYKRKVPEYLTPKVVEFSKIRPQDRFKKISQSVRFPSVLYITSTVHKYHSRLKRTIVRNSSWSPACKSIRIPYK